VTSTGSGLPGNDRGEGTFGGHTGAGLHGANDPSRDTGDHARTGLTGDHHTTSHGSDLTGDRRDHNETTGEKIKDALSPNTSSTGNNNHGVGLGSGGSAHGAGVGSTYGTGVEGVDSTRTASHHGTGAGLTGAGVGSTRHDGTSTGLTGDRQHESTGEKIKDALTPGSNTHSSTTHGSHGTHGTHGTGEVFTGGSTGIGGQQLHSIGSGYQGESELST
jgi:hypothetical protein